MINPNNIVNIGVLGIASIATRSIIPAIIESPEIFKLAGLASRDMAKATMNASLFNCKPFGSYESLLKDKSIKAVYIPLPNSLHYPFVKLALENGKHVMVEKSLGINFHEVKEMVDLAKNNNLVLLENFQFRFHSQLSAILKTVHDGTIGDLRSVRISFGFPPFSDKGNIRYDSNLGGGALLDVGAYAFKLATYFLGNDIEVVHGSMYFENNVDIWGQGVLKKNNNPLCCHFSYGFDNFYQCSLELWGSEGKLTTYRIFTAPKDLKPTLHIETRKGTEVLFLLEDHHFKNILQYFQSLILGCKSTYDEYEQNILQARLIDNFKSYVKG
jgi:NDP-hexose-3-ketoreductase